MPDFDLRIGIENEVCLRGHDPPLRNPEAYKLKDFANILVKLYNKDCERPLLRSGFSHDGQDGHHPSSNNQFQWTVKEDPGIAPHGSFDLEATYKPDVEGYPLEFTSSIYDFSSGSPSWNIDVRNHWYRLRKLVEPYVDEGCATHVHISPKAQSGSQAKWSMDQLKNVAQAVVYFEKAFDDVVAPSRRDHEMTRRNKAANHQLKALGFAECCKRIQACADEDHLVHLLQPSENHAGYQDLSSDRNYRWNFDNTKKDKKDGKDRYGTIEFRCAPGVLTGNHCLIWVLLAVYFVQAAAQYGTKEILEEGNGSSPKDLRNFILLAEPKHVGNRNLLDIPFRHPRLDTDEEMRDAFDESLRQLVHAGRVVWG